MLPAGLHYRRTRSPGRDRPIELEGGNQNDNCQPCTWSRCAKSFTAVSFEVVYETVQVIVLSQRRALDCRIPPHCPPTNALTQGASITRDDVELGPSAEVPCLCPLSLQASGHHMTQLDNVAFRSPEEINNQASSCLEIDRESMVAGRCREVSRMLDPRSKRRRDGGWSGVGVLRNSRRFGRNSSFLRNPRHHSTVHGHRRARPHSPARRERCQTRHRPASLGRNGEMRDRFRSGM